MSITRRVMVLFLSLILNMTMFAGCWNYREINTLGIVMALAIDKNKATDEFLITVEIVKSNGGENQGQIGRKVFESRGLTIFDAVRNLVVEMGRRAYWSHSKAVIIDDDIAEQDISPVLDWLYRDSELRRDVKVFIYKGSKASDVIRTSSEMDDTVGYNIYQTMRNQKAVNKYPDVELGEVVANLSEENKGIMMPAIVVRFEENRHKYFIEGSAILKGSKVVGYLNSYDTRNTLAVTGKLKKGTFPIKNLLNSENFATMELFGAKNYIKINYEDNRVDIKVESKSDMGIAEITGNMDFRQKDIRKKIEEDVERFANEDIKRTISMVQREYQCDIFEFGTKMRIQHPKEWKKIQDRWNELFISANIEVDINIHIRGSATASKPVKGGE